MAQEGSSKTIEEIRAEFLEIPTDKGPEAESKDLAKKMLENNIKLCMFAELMEQKAVETRNENQNDPKIEMLKQGKASLEVLKQYYRKIQERNATLRDELDDLKMKRQEKRFYDRNASFYVDYREKIFPMLMQHCDKKEDLLDEMNQNASSSTSEKEFKQITNELEKVKKENERLKKTEQDVIEMRRQNEAIEVETCRIQVRNIEMENEIRSFDEYVLESKIVELQEKIKKAKATKLKHKEEKSKEEFKNPNDFPTLLDFLDKSKKLKHKKKRKLMSPTRQPSKRRKNKTGSFSQHDNNGKLQNNEQLESKLLSPKSSRPNRSAKSPGTEKVQVLKSYGLQWRSPNSNSANLNAQTSNVPSNMLQRTYASRNLGNPSSSRPTLQRQQPVQLYPINDGMHRSRQKPKSQKPASPKPSIPKRPQRYEDYETDEDGNLLLQYFPSRKLFPEEPETRQEAPRSSSSNNEQNDDDYEYDEDGHLPLQHFPSRPLFPDEPSFRAQEARPNQSKNNHKEVSASKINNNEQNDDDYEYDEEGYLPLQHFPSRPLFPDEPSFRAQEARPNQSKNNHKEVSASKINNNEQNDDDYEYDEDGHLPLQHFPSRPLFPEKAATRVETPRPKTSKNIQKEVLASKIINNQPALPVQVVPIVEVRANDALQRMDTELSLGAAAVTKQPSVDRELRPRKSFKQKVSPKKAEKHDRKDVDRKKGKSPKKEVKKGRGRKKADKNHENDMMVDVSSPVDNSQIFLDENVTMTPVNDVTVAAVDNADKLMVVDDNSTNESSNAASSNEVPLNSLPIAELAGNNVMDVDQNAQVQGSGPDMPELTPDTVDEVSMEQESPGNDNIEMFDMEIENIDPNKTGEEPIEMSNSFERLFGSSPNTSGNLENHSFDFNFDNSRELDGSDSGGNKDNDDFFGFNTANNNKDDFFGDGSFKSNEGTADDFF